MLTGCLCGGGRPRIGFRRWRGDGGGGGWLRGGCNTETTSLVLGLLHLLSTTQ
jgi:hypothetical protein